MKIQQLLTPKLATGHDTESVLSTSDLITDLPNIHLNIILSSQTESFKGGLHF